MNIRTRIIYLLNKYEPYYSRMDLQTFIDDYE